MSSTASSWYQACSKYSLNRHTSTGLITNMPIRHCVGTPPNMNAPWYFAGANQANLLGNNVHSVPGFSDAQHDVLLATVAWVENGTTPTHIIGTKYENETFHDTVARQRPLCMYPQQAKYSGKGDVNKAASWECTDLY